MALLKKLILMTCQEETSKCSVKDAFKNPLYKNSTWVALLVMFWHEMIGNNAIMLYSTTMLEDM